MAAIVGLRVYNSDYIDASTPRPVLIAASASVLLVFNRISANKNPKQERTPWPGVSFAFVTAWTTTPVRATQYLAPETVQ